MVNLETEVQGPKSLLETMQARIGAHLTGFFYFWRLHCSDPKGRAPALTMSLEIFSWVTLVSRRDRSKKGRWSLPNTNSALPEE